MARGQFSKKDYLTCSLGKWRQKVDENTPNRIQRINEKGNTVNELVWDYVSGIIEKMYLEVNVEYGDKWCIQIRDGADVMILQVSVKSGYTSAMIPKLLNCDFLKPVEFRPYYFEEDKKARMVLLQDDQKVPNFYTREDPKDFPPFPTTGQADDLALWKIQTNKFLKKVVEEMILPKLPDPNTLADAESLNEATEVPESQRAHVGGPPNSDAPFPNSSAGAGGGEDNGPDDLPF